MHAVTLWMLTTTDVDLTRMQHEILLLLADPDAADLTITVEVEAMRSGGFGDDKIRS